MATPEMRQPEETLVRINREKPAPIYESKNFGTIKADWKLPWLIFVVGSSVGLIVIGAIVGLFWVGWAYAGCALLGYGASIHIPWFEWGKSSAITVFYRKGLHRYRNIMGHNWHLSLDPSVGEAFGLTNSMRSPPKPIKVLGKVKFVPHYIGAAKGNGAQRAVLGTAEDFKHHTLTGTLKVTFESLYSADADRRDRRLAAYAHLLDTLAQGDFYRFAFQDTTLLGEHHDPTALLDEILRGNRLNRTAAPNRDVLLRWIAQNNNNSVVHESTMSLSLYLPAFRHEAKQLDGEYGTVLERAFRGFYASVIGKGSGQSPIGLSSAKFLSHNDLVLLNLLRLDPVFAQPYWQQWRRPRDSDYLLNENLAWPDSSDFRSGEIVRLGETYHLGFYVEEFGEAGMKQDAFWELLGVPVPKTVTVVFQMITRAQARKKVERNTTAVKGFNRDRAMDNKRVTEFHAEDEREARQLEHELATSKGHVGKVRCYIDVTGDTPEQAHAYARVMRSAVTTNTPFVIKPLISRQLRGIDALLPLTRGLRT
jgi:hypothetical protein